MDVSTRFVVFQALIAVPFALGAVATRSLVLRDPARTTKKLVTVNLVILEPLVAFWSTWGIELTGDLVFLPVSGVFLVAAGLVFGLLGARVLGLEGRGRATFHISAALANHGFTMGAFLCFLLLGERGLGLASIFLSYFMPLVFLVIFPYARLSSGSKAVGAGGVGDLVLNVRNMPLYAVAAAVALSASGFSRPPAAFPLDTLVMASIALYYLTLGLTFEVPAFISSLRANAVLAFIKFAAVPAVTLILLASVELDRGVETVILVESFMPAAIYSVVASVLFDLDAALASAMFVTNTVVFLVVVLPAMWCARGAMAALIG